MIRKNDEYIGVITDMGSEGEGVLKLDNLVVFLPFGLVGEKVKYKILKVSSKFAYGKILEVLTPAENRIRPKCAVFGKCGGCQLQHLRYQNQLKLKEENIEKCFSKIADINVEVKPAIKSGLEFGYRNKLQLPVGIVNGKTEIGFYAENSHRIIPIDDCPINPDWTKIIISCFKKYIADFNVSGYDEITHSGDLREITVKEIEGNLIITLVVLDKKPKGLDRLIDILSLNLKGEFSLYINYNSKKSNVIYGNDFELVYGKPHYIAEAFGIKYKIGVRSFMQVNNDVCLKLYSTVRDLIDADLHTTVIDAYSGAGLMTALLSVKAKNAYGIEIIDEAVKNANELALMNGLSDKITNYCGKCEDVLPNLIKEERAKGSKLCLVLDPPRKGCDLTVIDSIIKSDIEKIVYVSCKPSTLARDVGLLVGSLETQEGQIKKVKEYSPRYEITCVKPFDMFPQTKHIETVVCLEKTM